MILSTKVECSNRVMSTLIRIMADKMRKPWPQVVPFVTCLLNNQTTSHLKGFSAQFILMGLQPALNQRFQKANRGIEDLIDIDEKWKEHNAFFQAQYEEVNERFNKIYATRGGIEHDFKEGDFVYMRDFRQIGRKKNDPTYFRCPLLVKRALDSVIITEDLDGSGIIRLIHGKNAKKASPFSLEQYQLLPEVIRVQLGHAFTPEEIEDIMKKEGLTKMPRLFKMKPAERFPWTSKRNIDPSIDLPSIHAETQRSSVTLEDPMANLPQDGFGPSVFLNQEPELAALDEDMLNMQADEQMQIVDGPNEVDINAPSEIYEKHVTFDLKD